MKREEGRIFYVEKIVYEKPEQPSEEIFYMNIDLKKCFSFRKEQRKILKYS